MAPGVCVRCAPSTPGFLGSHQRLVAVFGRLADMTYTFAPAAPPVTLDECDEEVRSLGGALVWAPRVLLALSLEPQLFGAASNLPLLHSQWEKLASSCCSAYHVYLVSNPVDT